MDAINLKNNKNIVIYDIYNKLLNECHGTVEIAGRSYPTATILKAIDLTAYHEGYSRFINIKPWMCSTCRSLWKSKKSAEGCCSEKK
jgi:hypothetical protein